MRAFPFLIVIALGVEALAGTAVASLVVRSLEDTSGMNEAPAFTQLFFGRPEMLWIIPSVFLVYALIIGVWREPSAGSIWTFTGASAIAAALQFGIISIASILPLLTFKG